MSRFEWKLACFGVVLASSAAPGLAAITIEGVYGTHSGQSVGRTGVAWEFIPRSDWIKAYR